MGVCEINFAVLCLFRGILFDNIRLETSCEFILFHTQSRAIYLAMSLTVMS